MVTKLLFEAPIVIGPLTAPARPHASHAKEIPSASRLPFRPAIFPRDTFRLWCMKLVQFPLRLDGRDTAEVIPITTATDKPAKRITKKERAAKAKLKGVGFDIDAWTKTIGGCWTMTLQTAATEPLGPPAPLVVP